MMTTWHEMRAEAEKLSADKTVEIQCPTCLAMPGERCVTRSKLKKTATHADRSERGVFELTWAQEHQTDWEERRMDMIRRGREQAGLTPDPHPLMCCCDEECWPRKVDEAEWLIEWSTEDIERHRKGMVEAEVTLERARQERDKLDTLRALWKEGR